MIRFLLVVGLVAACGESEPAKHLDLKSIRVSHDAHLRTDTVGEGKFVGTATFVLVDAQNTTSTGAYVTLGGELSDGKRAIGKLNSQSLWIPAGESRTFALVDAERKQRPDAKAARIAVRGALIDRPPLVRVEELHTFDDYGKQVVQAYVVNDADRHGVVMVIAAFHDRNNQPMTRPFSMTRIAPKSRRSVQFVGPPGSTRATIFIGDVVY